MKDKGSKHSYTDKEWEELSSLLSGEQNDNKNLLNRFMAEDEYNTIKYWKELKEMNNEREIDVDKAWNNLYSKLNENGLITAKPANRLNILRNTYFSIAAIFLLFLGIGSILLYMNGKDLLNRKTIVETSENQKNFQLTLPDGSSIYLNRNTKLSYRKNFGEHSRNVTLRGEAFFEITPDEKNPFIIDAGKARVKVLGTSFNVITNNPDSVVEVYVKTGKVIVSNIEGSRNMILDPEYVGKMDSKQSDKAINNNPNYLAWKTGLLVYNGQTLDIVFRDLKKVYDMSIVADNQAILENKWTTDPIDNQSQETIIRLICISFNLSYTKDGNVYHLKEK